ncbi:MAG: class II aldolase/adducin family protein [Nitrososphaerales archaeon]
MEKDEIKKEIVESMRDLYLRGLVTSSSGNISARIFGSEFLWITPTGPNKPKLKEDDLVKIDLDGRILEGNNKPSAEWRTHVEIFKVRKDVNAVVHTHNPFTIGVTMVRKEFKPVTTEASILLKEIATLPFKKPCSEELSKLVSKNIINRNALILRGHGVIGVGSDLNEAKSIVEVIEDDAIVQTVMKIFSKRASRY